MVKSTKKDAAVKKPATKAADNPSDREAKSRKVAAAQQTRSVVRHAGASSTTGRTVAVRRSRRQAGHDINPEILPPNDSVSKSTSRASKPKITPLDQNNEEVPAAIPTRSKKDKKVVADQETAKHGKVAAKRRYHDVRPEQLDAVAVPQLEPRQPSSDRETHLERENAELKKIIQQLRAGPDDQTSSMIPKPRGTVGSQGYQLQDEMKLVHNKDLYKSILRTVRDLCLEARVDFSVPYKGQSMVKLGKLFAAAAERQPYLRKFNNDWATGEIVRQFITGRRKYEIRKAKKEKEDVNDGDELDDFDEHWVQSVGFDWDDVDQDNQSNGLTDDGLGSEDESSGSE